MNFDTQPPVAATGIPFPLLTFSGGRTAVDLAPHGGITGIRFFGKQRLCDAALFRADPISAFAQLFRAYADFGQNEQYFLEFNQTAFYPFGYDSECVFRDVSFRHRLTLLNDAILFELEGNTEFRLKLGLTFAAVPIRKPTRKWNRFQLLSHENAILASCVDQYESSHVESDAELLQNRLQAEPCYSETFIAAGSVSPIAFRATAHDIQKDYCSVASQNGKAAIAVVFGSEKNETLFRLKEIAGKIAVLAEKEREEYRKSIRTYTKLSSSEPVLNSFVADFPEVLRALDVKDIPGAVCASNTGYWVWGWDSMVHTDSIMMSGDWENVKRRLIYYRDTAHPEHGIFHAINSSGFVIATMAPAAQTIYCIMLFHYFQFSRDKEGISEFYSFASGLLDRVDRDLIPETGLYRGTGLYPDFPEDLGQTGNDISSFNNSILFQALRSMTSLARKLGKNTDADRWKLMGDRLRDGFRKYLYDPEVHYFYDSIDSLTRAPRVFYPVYAILYLTPFAQELVEGIEQDVAEYMKHAFTQRKGVSMFARNNPVFYSDGNQLGMYSPVTEGFYRRMMQLSGNADGLLPILIRDWEKLQLSEATGCEAVNMGFTPDLPGKKQMYAAVSYYSLVFHLFCGLEMDTDTLSFHAPSRAADGWKIERLKIGGNVFDLEFSGSGSRIRGIELDGTPLPEKNLHPDSLANGVHHIKIEMEK